MVSVLTCPTGSGHARTDPPPKLPADWSFVQEYPAIIDAAGAAMPAERLILRVEEGWLTARLEQTGGGLEWQVVLARATEPTPPTVTANRPLGSLAVRYGHFFIREDLGRLRIYREKKTKESPPWPVPKADAGEELMASANNLRIMRASERIWLTAGAVAGKPDVRVRFQHAGLTDNGYGAQSWRTGLAYVFCGWEATCHDEGDLLTGRRVPGHEAEAVLNYRKTKAEFGNKPPPALAGGPWFNSPAPLVLDQLKGKVILLDFWGKWCGPCVAKLPAAQQLHETYHSKDLVIIGVHSAQQHESLPEFLKQRGVTFPVVIDSGKTAQQYLIGSWPTYFLIDRSGKVASGFTSQIPAAQQIEELLKKKQ